RQPACRGLVASQRDCVALDGQVWPRTPLSAGTGQDLASGAPLKVVGEGNVQYRELVDSEEAPGPMGGSALADTSARGTPWVSTSLNSLSSGPMNRARSTFASSKATMASRGSSSGSIW